MITDNSTPYSGGNGGSTTEELASSLSFLPLGLLGGLFFADFDAFFFLGEGGSSSTLGGSGINERSMI